MQKVWQWLRDRKTHTLRKWRSAMVGSRDHIDRNGRGNPRHVESLSALQETPSCSYQNVSQSTPDFEEFFEGAAPGIQEAIDRRGSFTFRSSPRRSRKTILASPVLPPDLDEDGWAQLKVDGGGGSPPQRRSPRQIRFKIPEVQISFEEEEPHNLHFEEEYPSRQGSPIPPPIEIEWSPAQNYSSDLNSMSLHSDTSRPSLRNVRPVSFDCSSMIDEQLYGSTGRDSSISNDMRRKSSLAMQRRQSNHQLVASMSGRRTSTTLIPLTQAQIHLVRSLWRQIYVSKGPTVIGTSIFHRLCFKCPTVKEQVRRCPLPPQFNNHDGFVKAHCKAMAELVDQIVEGLDNLDALTEELIRIGRVHARLLRGELTGKLWNTVAEVFIDCTLEWGDKRCRSETVRKAWALIVAFMVEKIKLGHHEQRKIMLSTRQSMPQIQIQLETMQIHE
ncbi:unnamed protein product, partial [Mesorhabditis belari]|uniref:Globin family profile domain-containing protein n=1 Tax=Mesorhabditis belari TaxID=2138241 RepID=A0AAF3FE47_9BILA